MNVESAPANARLVEYFGKRARQYHHTNLSEPHGTHPDLVLYLWDELGHLLPEDCHAVVSGGVRRMAER